MNGSRIIISLDFSDVTEVLHFVEKVTPDLCRLKIGKELFTKVGPNIVGQLIDKGFDIFLDLKFHDIPTTVSKACVVAADLGIWMLNIHASGGKPMMCHAREALDAKPNRPLLVGVTILTSIDDVTFKQLGFKCKIEEQVMRLAELSYDCGLDGVVCSAQEASLLRANLGKRFKLVAPGIRQASFNKDKSHQDDQKRIMSPAQAIANGVDYLVIGRPITQAKDPLQTLKDISTEIVTADTTNYLAINAG